MIVCQVGVTSTAREWRSYLDTARCAVGYGRRRSSRCACCASQGGHSGGIPALSLTSVAWRWLHVQLRGMPLRILGLIFLAGACVVGLVVVAPTPAKSQPSGISLGCNVNDVALVKEVGTRRARYRSARHWRYRYAKRPSQHRGYFGADPGRYFGVGPGSYECYGYDCNW
jgi:hypothetical protein